MQVAGAIKRGGSMRLRDRDMNDIKDYANIFDGIKPFSGQAPKGYLVDFLGTLTDARFRTMFGVDPEKVGGETVTTSLPTIEALVHSPHELGEIVGALPRNDDNRIRLRSHGAQDSGEEFTPPRRRSTMPAERETL